MKKSLLALAALTAFAGAASAQSSVTLFGIVDLNARNVKNGSAGSVKSLSQDGIASSRLGFRGVEDLGGGLRAGFHIEGAINPDTGTAGGQTWQRRSTVSLLGGFGELRLGRDYTPSFWNYTIFDPFGTNGVGSMSNTVDFGLGSGATTGVRANNSIGYHLPSLGGLYGQVMVAAGENVTGNKYIGGRIGYSGGPVNVAGAWGKTNRTGAMTDDYTDMNVGASFKLGAATLMGQYSKRNFDAGAAADVDQKTAMVGATVGLGAGTIKASYTSTSASTSAREAKQLAVGYVHDLSKRTAVYGTYARVKNEAGARFTAGSGGPTAPTAGGFTSTGYEFGVRHSF